MAETDSSPTKNLRLSKAPLQFITLTISPKPSNSDRASRQIIRSQAGRHGKKSAPVVPPSAKTGNPAKEYVKVKKSYTSTIKLSSWQRKSGRRKKQIAPQGEPPEVNNRPEGLAVPTAHVGQANLGLNFDVRVLDPINPLPISFFPGTATIIEFWSCMTTNSFALNPDGDWFDFIRTDSAALHALISVVGRVRCLRLGIEDDMDVQLHRAEAVRLINQRLRTEREHLSDGVIAAVAVLVNQEAMECDFETARIHFEGLVKMVELRGGIEKVNSRLVLQRVVTWADFCFSSAWGAPLRFPPVRSLLSALPLASPPYFSSLFRPDPYSVSDSISSLGVPRIVISRKDVVEAMEMLRNVTTTLEDLPSERGTKRTVSNSIYWLEHRLARINAVSTSAQSSQTSLGIGDQVVDVWESLAAAAYLFLHFGVRSIPPKAKRHGRLFKKIRASLPSDIDAVDWRSAPRLEASLLLWVCTVAAVDGEDVVARNDLLLYIEKLCIGLGVSTYEEFKSCIRDVLWVEPFCDEWARVLWEYVRLGVLMG